MDRAFATTLQKGEDNWRTLEEEEESGGEVVGVLRDEDELDRCLRLP